ncbi:TMEM164 family acyltransferase [Mycoplasma procyoni]|uniref:TMEM164 family acyltransferase n=1 Tax=Mycoplasma procyoni TaxID=568784 RepID=UPI00197CADE7|nr:YwaF family protein [Mycoplasma procyoni]MBN3534523.1 YwaF family protein [Mycoplasma procyoni]
MNFFYWRHNQASFEESKPLFLGIFGVVMFILILSWLFKSKIQAYFNSDPNKKYLFKTLSKDNLFVVIGVFAFAFNLLRIILIGVWDYPWKYEMLPLHLCRLLLVTTSLIFIFKRAYFVKYFSIVAFWGAVAAFVFANIGVIPEYVKSDIIYNNIQPDSPLYKNAGLNLGYDNMLYWDFILAHSFVLYVPVLAHFAYKEKSFIDLRSILIGTFVLTVAAVVIFFLNWIFNAIGNSSSNPKVKIALDANWFYLGQEGIGSLGKLSRWPQSLFFIPLIFAVLVAISYLGLIAINLFEIQFNKYFLPVSVQTKSYASDLKIRIKNSNFFKDWYLKLANK